MISPNTRVDGYRRCQQCHLLPIDKLLNVRAREESDSKHHRCENNPLGRLPEDRIILGIFDSAKTREVYPLPVREIWTPFLPVDLLLPIGLKTISLGTVIFASQALQQTIAIGDGVTTSWDVVIDFDTFCGFRSF